MFSSTNPYDEIIVKATDENLASEDWALNMEVCDKVSSDGPTGARNAIAALQKRLSHRNPNVQLYALELANTLAQNTGKPLLEELSSRNWTTSLERIVNDRTTNAAVKKKALGYIKAWAKQFEDTKDPNLALMGELYDQLRKKNLAFDEPEPVPEDAADARRRQEEEEFARVLELSKQDKGGRVASYATQPAQGSSSSSAPPAASSSRQQQAPAQTAYQPYRPAYDTGARETAPPPQPEPAPLDVNAATRVRALYTFTSAEVGELSFERGDIIKVLDRGFKEWWRGACNGRIGIFPVTYVEALAEPTARELQDEAQDEARVFASLGLVDQLLQTLKSIDPSRGDRLDDRPEVEQMYQASVGLQGQINALIKKYSDQKAELEHMNANFLRAMKQYEELRAPPPQAYFPAPQPAHDPYAQHPGYQHQPQHPTQPAYSPSIHGQAPAQQQYNAQPQQAFPAPHPAVVAAAAPPAASPDSYYAPQYAPQSQHPPQPHPHGQPQRIPSGAPSMPPNEPLRTGTDAGAAGMGAGADGDAAHKAAWDAYYRQQAEVQAQAQAQGHEVPPVAAEGYVNSAPQPAHVPYGQTPYPAAGDQYHAPPQQQQQQQRQTSGGYQPQTGYANGSVENLAQGVNRMTVHGQ